MKQIQWFPGHMFKSLREIKEKINLMDVICILVDARLPRSSMNPEVLKIVKDKPTIILFNKMDLADGPILDRFLQIYQKEGYITLKIDAQSGKNIQKIHALAESVIQEKIAKRTNKGLQKRAIRTMILGIPNVGKSTLINRLSGTKSAKTANTPGVTKSQQWVKISEDFDLLDTPGVLWPKFDDPIVGYHLAITGAIKDKILPEDDVVLYALTFLQKNYLKALQERYSPSINETSSYIEMLDAIAIKRGAFSKNKESDYDRVYQIVLTDIRNHMLGGLSFDRP